MLGRLRDLLPQRLRVAFEAGLVPAILRVSVLGACSLGITWPRRFPSVNQTPPHKGGMGDPGLLWLSLRGEETLLESAQQIPRASHGAARPLLKRGG